MKNKKLLWILILILAAPILFLIKNGIYSLDALSTKASKMVFCKSILAALKERLASLHHCSWSEALMKFIGQGIIISEYNLYVTFLTQCTNEKFKFLANANIALFRDRLNAMPNIYASLAEGFKSVSMHSFMNISSK